MRKTFDLTHAKIKRDRLVEAARRDVNAYVKRERRKALPEGVDFWDFDCRFGPTAEASEVVHVSDIGKCITAAQAQDLTSFYVEIVAKAGHRREQPPAR